MNILQAEKNKGTKLFPLKFMTGYELLFYSETAA